MLVRTCSQIGADPPIAAAAKSKKPLATAPVSTPASAADRPHSASPAAATYLGHTTAKHHPRTVNNNYMEEPPKPAKLNFKPYENTVLTPSPHQQHHQSHHQSNDDDSRPKSSSSEDNGGHVHSKKRKSASPRDDYMHHSTSKSSRRSSSSASSSDTATAATDPSTNPIIRSGLEVMHGTAAAAKAFCPPPPIPAHSPYKPDALAAFRHTYLPGNPWMPAAVSLAAAAASKPSSSSPSDCKDPMCGGPASGCGQQQQQQHHQHAAAAAALAFASQYHPMMAAAGGCPAGCVQCDHQRYLTSLMAAASVPAFYAPVARPYTCSWVIPGGSHQSSPTAEASAVPTLCGKSFGTSDELLQHIRTHTSGSGGGGGVSAAAMAAAGIGPMSPTTAAAFSAYNSHLSRHLFHHPSAYGKPPSMMPPSPYSAFNPTAAYCYPPPTAAAAVAAYHHQQHSLYSPRSDTSAATVSR